MLTVNRNDFVKALDIACDAVDRKHIVPIQNTIKLSAWYHYKSTPILTLESSNLDSCVHVYMPCEGRLPPMALCSPRAIVRALKLADSDTVTLSPIGDSAGCMIEAGDLAIEAKVLDANDHPGAMGLDEQNFTAMLNDDALANIARVFPAMGTDETRYYLEGVAVFPIDDGLYRFVATDGHRLMISEAPMALANGKLPAEAIIIPRDWIKRAFRRLKVGDGRTVLRYGGTGSKRRIELRGTLGNLEYITASKLVDGRHPYPDYERAIPGEAAHTATLPVAALTRAIRTLGRLVREKTLVVKFTFDHPGAAEVSVKSLELGTARLHISCEHDCPDGFAIGFNGHYVLDILRQLISDTVSLGLIDNSSPTTFDDPSMPAFRSVLMPVRI